MVYYLEAYNTMSMEVFATCDIFKQKANERQKRRLLGMQNKMVLADEGVEQLNSMLVTPDYGNLKAWLNLCLELARTADAACQGSAAWILFNAGISSYAEIEERLNHEADHHYKLKR